MLNIMNPKMDIKQLLLTLILIFATSTWLDVSAQSHRITGRVTNDDGEGVPDASVSIKGTAMRTRTDKAGSYALSTSLDSGVIVFSSIVYVTQEVPFVDGGQYDSVLMFDNTNLAEGVVIGDGTQIGRPS